LEYSNFETSEEQQPTYKDLEVCYPILEIRGLKAMEDRDSIAQRWHSSSITPRCLVQFSAVPNLLEAFNIYQRHRSELADERIKSAGKTSLVKAIFDSATLQLGCARNS